MSGLVEKRIENMGQKMERIIYTITEDGRNQLKTWLSQGVEEETVKFEILLKVFFGSMIEPKKNIDNIYAFKNKHIEDNFILKKYEEQLKSIQDQSADHIYYLLTVLFGRKINEAYLEWADEAVKILEELDETQTNNQNQNGGDIND